MILSFVIRIEKKGVNSKWCTQKRYEAKLMVAYIGTMNKMRTISGGEKVKTW